MSDHTKGGLTYEIADAAAPAMSRLKVRLNHIHSGRVNLQVYCNDQWWDVAALNAEGRLYRFGGLSNQMGLCVDGRGRVKSQDEP